jgi:pyruvate/2-oxoglutarate dehydrogenase complex dihydrolipoamide acyltransferase (E2) component
LVIADTHLLDATQLRSALEPLEAEGDSAVVLLELPEATFTVLDHTRGGSAWTAPALPASHAGSISLNSIRSMPAVIALKDGSSALAVRPIGTVVLSWDPQLASHHYAARFLNEVKKIVEARDE